MADRNRSPPESQLRLEWVYGYRGHQCRNNLFYTKEGEVVYFVAGVGVVLNLQERKQKFFLGHNDDILSLAIHPEKTLVASGQIGKDPFICVWDSTTTDTVSILQKGHERGIGVLNFSSDGELLVSVGQDDYHIVNVWKWKEGKILASSRGHNDKVLDAQFNPYAKNALVTCGVKHIKFWKLCGNSLTAKKGIFGKAGNVQTMLCVSFGSEEATYSGSLSGGVYKWKDRTLVQVIDGYHKGAVNSIFCLPSEGFATGSADGTVCLWDSSFSFVTQLDLRKAMDGYPTLQVRSVCWDGGRLLAGTRDSEVFQVSLQNRDSPACVMQGHTEGELWALAVHPTQPFFATGSDDRTIRMWNASEQSLVVRCTVPHAVRSLAFSPDGAHLAAGFQGGSFVVLNASDFSELTHIKDRKEVLHEMRYSPNGLFLAVGSNDNFVDVYSVRDNYKRVGVCKGASSFITHLDWSKDSQHLQINSGASERLFYHMPDGKRIPSSAAMQSIEWATWTGVLGDEVSGVWPKYSQVNDINATHASYRHGTIVTGDDFGLVKLFRFPCTAKGAKFRKYVGHAAHVTNVRFLSGDSHVISVGGADNATFQWRFLPHGEEGLPLEAHNTLPPVTSAWLDSDTEGSNTDASDVPSLDSDLEQESAKSYTRVVYKEDIPKIRKQLKRAESSKLSKSRTEGKKTIAPNTSLSLEFVHGYRGYDCRNNLYYLTNGDVVYHIAALGIVYSTPTHKQKYYGGHSDDILCLALHPTRDFVATGQVGRDPPIHIWNAVTMEPISVLKGEHFRGICALDFSGDGKKLASVGLDDDHVIVVWDWRKGEKMATTRGHKDKIFVVRWSPSSSDQLITVGVKHIKFWTQAGGGFTSKRGIFGKKEKQCTMLCVVFGRADGHAHTGGADGRVYHWEGNSLKKAITGHSGPIFAMQAVEKGFVTGGKDGKVCLWDEAFQNCLKTYDLASTAITSGGGAKLVMDHPPVRALALGQGKILVGTKNSEILEVEKGGPIRLLIQGHMEGEVWGLARHPSLPLCATASDDGSVRMWDTAKHQMTGFISLSKAARCVDFSPDGSHLAVGLKDGCFVVLSTEDLSEVAAFHHRKQEISDVKFSPASSSSPGGKYLAVGSHENFVDIYNVFTRKRVGVCKGASSYITHVDWDRAGKLLRVNTGDREVLYFEAPRGKQHFINRDEDMEIEWATCTGVLGKTFEGIWPPYSDVTDVNAAMVSPDGSVIATGDDFGYVKLFTFPSMGKHAKCKQYGGHSAHVTNVRWSCDGSKLISTGGADLSVMVWGYSGAEGTDGEFPASQQSFSLVEDSDTDPEEEEDGGYDSDVQREKDMDYISKTYAHPARDVTAELKGTKVEKKPATNKRYTVSRDMSQTAKVVQHQSKREGIKDLTLDFVFGYRGSDSRQNLCYTPSGEVLFHAAGAGIVYNQQTNTQSFFLEHSDDIIALALNRCERFSSVVATGQIGKTAPVFVWDYISKETLSILHGAHEVGVCSVDFSCNGKLLLTVGLGPSHSVAVWKWQEGTKIAQASGAHGRIFIGQFRPDSDTHFVTVGVRHVKFWTVAGSQLLGQRGIIPQSAGAHLLTMLSVAFAPTNTTYTGSVNGDIYEWKGTSLARIVSGAHTGPVFAMFTCLEDGLMVTGGKEKSPEGEESSIKLWDTAMTRSRSFSLKGIPLLQSPPIVRSLCRSKGKVLIGTQSNEIVELVESGNKVKVLLQSHGEGELGGLSTSPADPNVFVTASSDKSVRMWSIDGRRLVSHFVVEQEAKSVDISPDGRLCAVGLGNGEFLLLEVGGAGLREAGRRRDRSQPVQCVRFNPSGEFLAVGSDDGCVDVYRVTLPQGVGSRVGYCKGLSGGVTHIDWSEDSKFIQVDTSVYKKEVYSVPSGSHVTADTVLQPITWASWTSILGHDVIGIWPQNANKADINTAHVANCGQAIATGDDFGTVKLFDQFPVEEQFVSSRKYFGHSALVSQVRFTATDEYLLSAGGEDYCVFVWKTS